MNRLRNIALFILLAAAFSAANATVVFWGDGFGDIGFGLAAHPSGSESAAFGDYAASLSQGIWRSSFVGAYAGANGRALRSSVYLGDEAGIGCGDHDGVVAIGSGAAAFVRGATNVVAIGSSAMAGWGGLSDATYVNGQLYMAKGDGIFLTDDPTLQFSSAPLYYTNGVWTLRGNVHVQGRMTREAPGTGETVEVLGAWPGDFDYYLDARRGDDGNSGRLGFPCLTITGVVARVDADIASGAWTNGIPQIGVMRGSYDYPGTISTNAMRFVSVQGRDATVIEPPDAADTNAVRRMGMPNGNVTALTTFRGFTLRGFNASQAYGGGARGEWWKDAAFFLLAFEDCVFEDASFFQLGNQAVTSYCYIFNYCFLDHCEVRPTVRFRSDYWTRDTNDGVAAAFNSSEFYSCIIRLGEDAPDGELGYANLAVDCYFDNCLVYKPKLKKSRAVRKIGETVTGRTPGIYGSTILIGEHVGGTFMTTTPGSSWAVSVENSIVADGTNTDVYGTTSWYPTYGQLTLGDDLRPTDDSKIFFGYKSGEGRRLRNAILEAVAAALNDQGYEEPVVTRLLAARQLTTGTGSGGSRELRVTISPASEDEELED